jgi:hypothetical protein
LRGALEVDKVVDGKALVPLLEKGSTAVDRTRSRISALPDQW